MGTKNLNFNIEYTNVPVFRLLGPIEDEDGCSSLQESRSSI